MAITVDLSVCTACRTCQLMCSLHQTGRFQPAKASITINRDNIAGSLRWIVDTTCDMCVGEKLPLCISHCSYGALSMGDRL